MKTEIKKLTIRIGAELLKTLKIHAVKKNTTMSELITNLIEREVSRG